MVNQEILARKTKTGDIVTSSVVLSREASLNWLVPHLLFDWCFHVASFRMVIATSTITLAPSFQVMWMWHLETWMHSKLLYFKMALCRLGLMLLINRLLSIPLECTTNQSVVCETCCCWLIRFRLPPVLALMVVGSEKVWVPGSQRVNHLFSVQVPWLSCDAILINQMTFY